MEQASASTLRLALARVYGRADMCTDSQWHVLCCLTPVSTIGLLDIAAGTAWETGLLAPSLESDDLLASVYAATNAPHAGGPVRIDGVLVQYHGTHVEDGRPVPPTMPEGWLQIALPTWMGYDGDGRHRVPSPLYRPETWVRPTLVVAGLRTCYGTPGDRDGAYLCQTSGWGHRWPWGVPPWIEGESLSPFRAERPCHCCHGRGYTGDEALTLECAACDGRGQLLRILPRGTDAEELARAREALTDAVERAATQLRGDGMAAVKRIGSLPDDRFHSDIYTTAERQAKQRELRSLSLGLRSDLPVLLEQLERHGAAAIPPPDDSLWGRLTVLGNWTGVRPGWMLQPLRCAHERIGEGLPWDAAAQIRLAGVSRLVVDQW